LDTDEQEVFISESSVYRILKPLGLTQLPQHDFLQAADEFHTKTNFVNEMWQTDFTKRRQQIKEKTLQNRKKNYQQNELLTKKHLVLHW